MESATKLRQLMNAPGPILAPGIYDCISAKVVERAGFEAAFVSGAAVTASVLGYPDVGLQTMPEILAQVRNMARCVDIPLIVDIDTGYGNALNMMRAIREFEHAGAAGVFFEDQGFPKRCGHFEGKKLVSADDLKRVAPLVLRHRLRRNPLDDTGSDARVQRALQEVVPA